MKLLAGLLVTFSLMVLTPSCLAASDYVLPYPGPMPGNKLYQLEQVIDRLSRYWAFGNFSRHQYERRLADKKLVEAKTLFEYRQYLLATEALEESSHHFENSLVFLEKAENQGKDISQKLTTLKSASEKHQEVLTDLKAELPEKFDWRPENDSSITLNIGQLIDQAVSIREI